MRKPKPPSTAKYTEPSTTYAFPAATRSFATARISGMCPLTRGYASASSTPSARMSARYSSANFAASASGGMPSSFACRVIGSSTSVRFTTHRTSCPRNSRYRRITSNATYERAWPMWLGAYTVGPQTYIRTGPSARNSAFLRVRVL